jgi:hypothetical protein
MLWITAVPCGASSALLLDVVLGLIARRILGRLGEALICFRSFLCSRIGAVGFGCELAGNAAQTFSFR